MSGEPQSDLKKELTCISCRHSGAISSDEDVSQVNLACLREPNVMVIFPSRCEFFEYEPGTDEGE